MNRLYEIRLPTRQPICQCRINSILRVFFALVQLLYQRLKSNTCTRLQKCVSHPVRMLCIPPQTISAPLPDRRLYICFARTADRPTIADSSLPGFGRDGVRLFRVRRNTPRRIVTMMPEVSRLSSGTPVRNPAPFRVFAALNRRKAVLQKISIRIMRSLFLPNLRRYRS